MTQAIRKSTYNTKKTQKNQKPFPLKSYFLSSPAPPSRVSRLGILGSKSRCELRFLERSKCPHLVEIAREREGELLWAGQQWEYSFRMWLPKQNLILLRYQAAASEAKAYIVTLQVNIHLGKARNMIIIVLMLVVAAAVDYANSLCPRSNTENENSQACNMRTTSGVKQCLFALLRVSTVTNPNSHDRSCRCPNKC